MSSELRTYQAVVIAVERQGLGPKMSPGNPRHRGWNVLRLQTLWFAVRLDRQSYSADQGRVGVTSTAEGQG